MRMHCIVVVVFALAFCSAVAQSDDHTHHHDHHLNEIGVANAAVYFIEEEEVAYGVHVHYVRNFLHSRFGVGVAYERIFDEHKHNTLGLVGLYRPAERLSVSISPGLTFEDGISGSSLAVHLEAAYEFEIGDFHIGPVIEFAYDPEDVHISLGLHVGYGF